MPRKKVGRPLTLIIPEDIRSEIDRIARKRDIPAAQVYRMMLRVGIDCHKDMEKVGVIAAVDFAYYVKETIRRRLDDKKGPKQLELL